MKLVAKVIAAVALVSASTAAFAAEDLFLTFDNNVTGHPVNTKGRIDVDSFSFGVDNARPVVGSHGIFGGDNGRHFAAPEIDPASAASGLTLLVAGLIVLRGRKKSDSLAA